MTKPSYTIVTLIYRAPHTKPEVITMIGGKRAFYDMARVLRGAWYQYKTLARATKPEPYETPVNPDDTGYQEFSDR